MRRASFALWTSAGGAKSQTGREISCQPQRHRQGEGRRGGGESDGPRESGRDRRGGVRIVRGAMVETVKEGGSKAPGFSRDLCEIPAMPRVKKKTALRCANLHLYSCRPPRPSLIPAVPPPSPHRCCESSSGNGNGRGAPFRRWKSLAFRGVFRGTVKRTAIYEQLTPTGSRLPEVICRDMVINANRKIAGTIDWT